MQHQQKDMGKKRAQGSLPHHLKPPICYPRDSFFHPVVSRWSQAVDKRPWPKEMEVMKHEIRNTSTARFGMETGEEILIYNIYVNISNSSFTHTQAHWSFSASLSAWKSKKPCLGRLEWFAQDTRKLLNYWTSRHQLMKQLWHVMMGFYRVQVSSAAHNSHWDPLVVAGFKPSNSLQLRLGHLNPISHRPTFSLRHFRFSILP